MWLQEILVMKPPKRSPLLLRTAVVMFSMVCGVFIFSACLKQISTQARTTFVDFKVIDNHSHGRLKLMNTPHLLHYPKPLSFSRYWEVSVNLYQLALIRCSLIAMLFARNECAHNPVLFFAILSNQRSGSGWFETLLNSHINVSSNGEIFSVRERRKNVSSILQTLDKVYNLDWFNSASKNECSAATGLKWMLNQVYILFKFSEYLQLSTDPHIY